MSKPRAAKKSTIERQATPRAELIRWLMPLLVVLLTVSVFLPALHNGFVNWDDDDNFVKNPLYRGLGWTELRWMFTTIHMGNYRPLTWMTLGLDYVLWGMDPFGYHLTSLLLHAVSTLLFYFLTLRLLSLSIPAASAARGLRVAAGLAALIFSIHPMRVEAVVWISARNHVLSNLFYLLTILCYLRATGYGKSSPLLSRWLTGAVILFGLSLLSQPSGITLPFVLLILDVYPLRRLGGGPRKWLGPEARRLWWEKLPFLLLALGAGIIALMAKQQLGAMVSFAHYGLWARLSQALYGLGFYLWKTVMPVELSPLYQPPPRFDPWGWPFLLNGVTFLAATAALVLTSRVWPAGMATWLCYIAILAPVLGVAQSGPQLVADRYSYLSCLGWALLAGAGLARLWRICFSGRTKWNVFVPVGALAVALMAGLGILTWKQTQVWHDSESLWRWALAVNPVSSMAHYNLGEVLQRDGRLEEAIDHIRLALQGDPTDEQAHYNLGVLLHRRGELDEAVVRYRRAIQINPGKVEARINLGIVLAQRGQLEEAMAQIREALKINPGSANAHDTLGWVLVRRGELRAAEEEFREAVRIDRSYWKGYLNLAKVLALQGRLEEAVDQLRQAVRIEPGVAEIHETLARMLERQGKEEEASQYHQEALKIIRSRTTSPRG